MSTAPVRMTLVHTILPGDSSSNENSPAIPPPTVLVLGDFEENGDQIAWLLRISGYHALFAPDVASAKMLLAYHHPALIVTNIPPPGPCEPDRLEQVRNDCPDAVVLIISDDVT